MSPDIMSPCELGQDPTFAIDCCLVLAAFLLGAALCLTRSFSPANWPEPWDISDLCIVLSADLHLQDRCKYSNLNVDVVVFHGRRLQSLLTSKLR